MAFMGFAQSNSKVEAKPLSEVDIKKQMIVFKGAYNLKVQFHLVCTHEEVLNSLQNHKIRAQWDYNCTEAVPNIAKNVMKVTYGSSDASFPGFFEEVQIQHMKLKETHYIIEKVSSPTLGTYERVWIMETVQNRPNHLRVTFLSSITSGYHRSRSNCTYLMKSLAALKNLICQSDRDEEWPVDLPEEEGHTNLGESMVQ